MATTCRPLVAAAPPGLPRRSHDSDYLAATDDADRAGRLVEDEVRVGDDLMGLASDGHAIHDLAAGEGHW